jgi:hypothetical protein
MAGQEVRARRAAHEQRLLARFSDTHSIAELESLDSAELLHRALGAAPDGAISLGWCRPLGHVLESQNTAYVLFWLGEVSEPVPFDDPLVAKLERIDCEWKLVLDPDSRWGIPGFRNIFFGVGSDWIDPNTPTRGLTDG